MRYISVNEGTICGETPTLAATLLFKEVTEQPLEQSAGTAAQIRAEALTEATTPGHGYMKRCRDNMRSVLGEADTLKSAGISPGLMWKKRRISNIKRPTYEVDLTCINDIINLLSMYLPCSSAIVTFVCFTNLAACQTKYAN